MFPLDFKDVLPKSMESAELVDFVDVIQNADT